MVTGDARHNWPRWTGNCGSLRPAFIGHLAGVGGQPHPSLAMRACARVWLTTAPQQSERHDLLVNLAPQVPAGLGHYSRLIEVVAPHEEDRLNARKRWRHYAAQGTPWASMTSKRAWFLQKPHK